MTNARGISHVASTKEVTSQSQFITVATMQQAEMILIRAVQAIHFGKEIEALTSVKHDSAPSKNHAIKKSSSLFKLDPFLDSSGTLRVGGRLKFAEMPEFVKFPVILPGKSHFASLIVRHCHEQINHQGRGMTINEVRSSGYWIVGGSSAVASYIARCVKCPKSEVWLRNRRWQIFHQIGQNQHCHSPLVLWITSVLEGRVLTPWTLRLSLMHSVDSYAIEDRFVNFGATKEAISLVQRGN